MRNKSSLHKAVFVCFFCSRLWIEEMCGTPAGLLASRATAAAF